MAISEERLQLLLPKQQKVAVQKRARDLGLSVGEYLRRLVETDLQQAEPTVFRFPFGENPIHTGRERGSIEHDRPE